MLPTAWLLVGGTIAVSLAALAFGGSTFAGDDAVTPTAARQDPIVAVERGSIDNELEIAGTILVDPPVKVDE